MKKVLFITVVACMTAMGYAQMTIKPRAPKQPAPAQAPKNMSALVLPKTAAQKKEFIQWQQLYGFTEYSHIYYNLAVLLNIADQHGTTISNNRDYVYMILAQDDPNSLASMVVESRRVIKELEKRIEALEKPTESTATQPAGEKQGVKPEKGSRPVPPKSTQGKPEAEIFWMGSPEVANWDGYFLNNGWLLGYEIGFHSNNTVVWRTTKVGFDPNGVSIERYITGDWIIDPNSEPNDLNGLVLMEK